MSIISTKEVTPRNIRAVIPEKYKGMAYHNLTKGEKVALTSCVFSVYDVTKEKDGETKVYRNITVYFGLGDGTYTSLKNDIVLGQMIALTGFDERSDVGYYPFDFPTEEVEIVEVTTKMGTKDVPVLAFQQ